MKRHLKEQHTPNGSLKKRTRKADIKYVKKFNLTSENTVE